MNAEINTLALGEQYGRACIDG